MYASSTSGIVGTLPVQSIGQVDSEPRIAQGFILGANDNYWGSGEYVYGRAGGNIAQFAICVITPTFNATLGGYRYDITEVTNTANLGRSLCVAMNAMSSGEYGWFQVTGVTPVKCGASVNADTTFGITAAGTGGANSAGKQILNARVIAPATTTVVKANCIAVKGTKILRVPNSDGWFVGAYLSGTGIDSGTTVAAISNDGLTVTLSTDTTAAVNGSVTATYNNSSVYYNVAHINRPLAQGAIT